METAVVHPIHARKRLVGYAVYVEWIAADGCKHGRYLAQYRIPVYEPKIAERLANQHRDDFNSAIE